MRDCKTVMRMWVIQEFFSFIFDFIYYDVLLDLSKTVAFLNKIRDLQKKKNFEREVLIKAKTSFINNPSDDDSNHDNQEFLSNEELKKKFTKKET